MVGQAPPYELPMQVFRVCNLLAHAESTLGNLELFFQLFCIFYGVGVGVVVEVDVDGAHVFGPVFEPFGPVL